MYPSLASAHSHRRLTETSTLFFAQAQTIKHKTTIETMSDGLQIVGRWPPEPPNTPQTPFAPSVATGAVHLIDGPIKQPWWTKHKRGRCATIVGDDVLIYNM